MDNPPKSADAAKAEREARLAQALRANLRRRKALRPNSPPRSQPSDEER